MILKRIFRTYSFRFAVLYVLTISVVASVISSLVYLSISYDYFEQVHDAIRVELDDAVEIYAAQGSYGFEQHVKRRTGPDISDRYYFVLAGKKDDEVLAGNLEVWPNFNSHIYGWLSFEKNLFDAGDSIPHDFVGRSLELDDGNRIMVARNYEDINQRVELVATTIIQSTIVTILLGLIGGAYISAGLIRRIDNLNRSIVTIMQGNLSERLLVTPRGGEIDQLASQLNIMLDRIENSMSDVREVSNNIAHDLRTPLTRLRNKLSLLETRSSPHNKDMVREMLVEADHLLSTFSALLRISQVESGAKKANFADVDLTTIFVDVMELYEPVASVKGIDLKIDRADPAHILGDKDLMFQMLANLMDNSIKYTPNDGAITIGLYVDEEKNKLRMVYSDNGPGIPVEKYTKVFQRFYRVDESRGIQPGNGLGLSLVQAVAILHGGDINLSDSREFHPQSVTPGLQVNIELPLVTPTTPS